MRINMDQSNGRAMDHCRTGDGPLRVSDTPGFDRRARLPAARPGGQSPPTRSHGLGVSLGLRLRHAGIDQGACDSTDERSGHRATQEPTGVMTGPTNAPVPSTRRRLRRPDAPQGDRLPGRAPSPGIVAPLLANANSTSPWPMMVPYADVPTLPPAVRAFRPRNRPTSRQFFRQAAKRAAGRITMDSIIYLVGLVVVVMAILSLLGLR